MTLMVFATASLHSHAHELNMARFNISENPNGYSLSIKLEKKDLLIALQEQYNLSHTPSTENVIRYVHHHFLLSIDDADIEYQLDWVGVDEHFYYINGKLLMHTAAFKKVKVHNTCLLDSSDQHANILKISAQGSTHSFRMDKDRTTTTVEY